MTENDVSMHPSIDIDDTIHQRVRLGVMAILDETGTADFTYLQSALGQSAGNTSLHIDVLAGAGLVTTLKEFNGRKPRTRVQITALGRTALASYVSTIMDCLNGNRARALSDS